MAFSTQRLIALFLADSPFSGREGFPSVSVLQPGFGSAQEPQRHHLAGLQRAWVLAAQCSGGRRSHWLMGRRGGQRLCSLLPASLSQSPANNFAIWSWSSLPLFSTFPRWGEVSSESLSLSVTGLSHRSSLITTDFSCSQWAPCQATVIFYTSFSE